MHPAWAWVTDHWFLSFILAFLMLRMVNKIVGAFIRRFAPKPDPPAAVEEPEEPDEEEIEEDEDEEAQPVVVTKGRSRFERL
jgi:Na+-transporting methylmalonyl-CoA/oxaloacetate decarboxylase gamma subunit